MKFFSSAKSAKASQPSERRLKIFLCHASEDKPKVRDLRVRLKRDGFEPWLDENELLPGQDWQIEIFAAVATCNVFLACLSQSSVTKEGFLQKEIARALDKAEEKPEGTIYIIPLRFEAVAIPQRLAQKQWANIFEEDGYLKLMKSLEICAERMGAHVSPLVVLPDSDLVSGAIPIPIVPRGRVDVGLCDDMTCHLRGAPELWQTLEKRFIGIPRSEVSFSKVSCLGRCDHAPALVVNDTPYDGLASDKAISIISQTLAGQPPKMAGILIDHKALEKALEIDPYVGQKPYGALKRIVTSGIWDSLSDELKASQLRGMGGAGYPTWLKWNTVRSAHSTDKYVICNAHDSEPGAIKDRFLLSHVPHLVVEGLALAGLFVGAKRGYLFVRREYQDQITILRNELERCRNEGLIGENILGTGLILDIELFVSPGGYICGEETALVEAIEGKRAQPRNKPPFVATVGLWGKPTVVNNVETLVFAAAIAAKGADWFKSHGDIAANTAVRSRGLKFVGVSGDVQAPGVFEVPMGTTYEDLIYKYARGLPPGRDLVAFAPSGPSSGFLPASKIKLPLDWDALRNEKSMVGSGAVVVCAKGTCMLDMALNAVRFYRNESCGKCVPCHSGSKRLVELLEGWTKGSYKEGNLTDINNLSQALRDTSICGLGQILSAPLESVLRHFRAEVDEHIHQRYCRAGICFPNASRLVQVVVDGKTTLMPEGTTILEAARQLNVEIPAPCHQVDASPGGCRVCIVELEQKKNERNIYQSRPYATACTRVLEEGQDQYLIISTHTPGVQATRKTLLGLMMADHHAPCRRQMESGDCELERLAARLGVTRSS